MNTYKFKPRDDITAKDLAEIFTVIMNALIQGIANREWNPLEDLEVENPIFNTLSSNAQKHFEPTNDK